ncbi:transcriptional regulator, TetR family [Lentzea xinjiangensis]|uniref:Transcriptional regulator, TetR family n=1 Tax=Lentzea xinjiangensis TaxID=402600 RepID=A0A1H9K8L5_9PSEU|nr:TetR/AcrR family transcriptional regulator [Lentzea xinjiangensis]SEQ95459.1 transcriptional regulator, TetR family [Lentzea xinjiangensis]
MTEELATGKRADARRNRVKIVEAARQALAETGDLPSLAEISRRAGVGMATLYRNFPGRPELVEELYRSQVDDICSAAATAEGSTPGEALFAWLTRFHAAGARKGPLAMLLLEDSGGDSPVLRESRSRVIAAAQPLFTAAADSGEVRDDVSLGQVLDAVVALERVRDDPASGTSMIDVLFDGLRRQNA